MKALITVATLTALLTALPAQADWLRQHFTSPVDAVPEGYAARPVNASASRTLVFSIVTSDGDMVADARQALLAQCAGAITGVSSLLMREPHFFYYKDRLELSGLCLEPVQP
ncbi:hypothetical protein [Oceanobacter mangrovi]|uniref:hypothetical protein n=1 Tax=Oceanobacter mangrovi TaxID=2862510 RepID=UPI001C8DABAD|nr:hypothetical protein [Oceanobacter mangrovi]